MLMFFGDSSKNHPHDHHRRRSIRPPTIQLAGQLNHGGLKPAKLCQDQCDRSRCHALDPRRLTICFAAATAMQFLLQFVRQPRQARQKGSPVRNQIRDSSFFCTAMSRFCRSR